MKSRHSSVNQVPREVPAEVFVPCLLEIKRWPVLESRSTKDDVPLLLCNIFSSRQWLFTNISKEEGVRTRYTNVAKLEMKKEVITCR